MTTTISWHFPSYDRLFKILDEISACQNMKNIMVEENQWMDYFTDLITQQIDICSKEMSFDFIKDFVNKCGILEIMDLIKDADGDEGIKDLMEQTMDMRYRRLFNVILEDYIWHHLHLQDEIDYENELSDADTVKGDADTIEGDADAIEDY